MDKNEKTDFYGDKYVINQYGKAVYPGTVADGTLRSYYLFHAFVKELRWYGPRDAYRSFPVPDPALYHDDHDYWTSDDCDQMIGEMIDALDDCAPDGFYFGAHPGNGSDFGFWELEDDDVA